MCIRDSSSVVRSEAGEGELMYWNAESGEEVKAGAKEYRDEAWVTSNCTVGWSVQGIWGKGSNAGISVCDRSSFSIGEYQLLAVGDSLGIVRLYRYPCVDKKAKAIERQGHASQITNVKFGTESKYVFSTGGEDRCVFQWKFE
eukprot:TRINITY_DN15634_c0_g1_i1.p2 TRINITY_DN15634_c0_g1~~TRINITY_DN15634_c0_g1_i1.p2  ORF type:complete len:143 (-),score=30.30 TRINITY_DN15634_c0_g1_i1:27-455(-)